MGKDSEDNEEDDGSWKPGPKLVCVNDLVAEERDQERAECDDQDAGISWDAWVDGMDQLCADD